MKHSSYNGSFLLQFGSYYDFTHKDGFITNKCLDPVDSGIKEVKGTFSNDILQVQYVIHIKKEMQRKSY